MEACPTLLKLVSHEDTQVKKNACIAIGKAMKLEKAQIMAREHGLIQVFTTQLGSSDPIASSSAALAIKSVSKNEINQAEFVKLGVLDQLFKHIQNEEVEPRRESIGALTSFSNNGIINLNSQNETQDQRMYRWCQLYHQTTFSG